MTQVVRGTGWRRPLESIAQPIPSPLHHRPDLSVSKPRGDGEGPGVRNVCWVPYAVFRAPRNSPTVVATVAAITAMATIHANPAAIVRGSTRASHPSTVSR